MLTTNNARGEHLLWLAPMLYIWVASIIAPIQSMAIYWDGDYYTFSFLNTSIIFLVCTGIPYLLHKHFRENKTRSLAISWMHILCSVLLMLSILMIYTYNPPIDKEWRYSSLLLPHFERWRFINDFALVLFATFVLVQIVYSIYGFGKLIRSKFGKSHNSEMGQYAFGENQVAVNPALNFR